MQTTVRRQIIEPTLEEDESLVPYDSTDPPEPVSADTGHRLPVRPEPSAFTKFLKERWPELVIFGALAFVLIQMFSMNREIGELQTKLEAVDKVEPRANERIDKAEERLQEAIKRLEDRVDRPDPPAQAPPAPLKR